MSSPEKIKYKVLAEMLCYTTSAQARTRMARGEVVSLEDRQEKTVKKGTVISDFPEEYAAEEIKAGNIREVTNDKNAK